MIEFLKKYYLKYGGLRFLVGFSIFFSVVVTFIAVLLRVYLLGTGISMNRVILISIIYLLPGFLSGLAVLKLVKK